LETIKLKYRVIEVAYASCFGEILRIQIQNKSLNEKKPKQEFTSAEEEEEQKKHDFAFSPEIYTLTTI
jgi:hypothetical protein